MRAGAGPEVTRGLGGGRALASAATLLVVACLLTAMSPWGTDRLSAAARFGFFLGCNLCWKAGLVAGRSLLRRLAPGWSGVRYTVALALAASLPGCAGIALLIRLLFGRFPTVLPFYAETLVLGVGVALAYRGLFLLPNAPAEGTAALPTAVPPARVASNETLLTVSSEQAAASDPVSAFLQRHTPILAGHRLLALEAEDHYLRIHAGGRSELVLLRMRDAVAQLGPDVGWQPHRSFWVASNARARAERRGQGWQLTLENGLVVPVSRTALPAMRAAGFGPQSVLDPASASAVGSTAE